MNLYKLHTNAKTELDGYEKMNELAHASIKTVQNNETTYRNVFGQLHRDDGPAVTYFDGQTANYINGRQVI